MNNITKQAIIDQTIIILDAREKIAIMRFEFNEEFAVSGEYMAVQTAKDNKIQILTELADISEAREMVLDDVKKIRHNKKINELKTTDKV